MKVSTVSDLLEMSPGSVPEAFRGTIKSVFRPNTGNGANGPFHLQKLLVSDGNAQIEVMFDGRPEVSRQQEGSEVYCIASRGQRGLGGLKRKDNDYKNKVTPQVWVYDNADVSFNGDPQGGGSDRGGGYEQDGGDNSPPPRQQQNQQQGGNRQQYQQNGGGNRQQGNYNNGGGNQRQQAPQGNNNGGNRNSGQQSNQNQRQQQAPQGGGDNRPPQKTPAELQQTSMRDFNVCLGKNASALQRCFDAAFGIVSEINERRAEEGGFSLSNGEIKELAVTLFINTSKQREPGIDRFFPVLSFQKTEEKIAANSAPQQN